jgi:hypothetical protein
MRRDSLLRDAPRSKQINSMLRPCGHHMGVSQILGPYANVLRLEHSASEALKVFGALKALPT